MIPSIFTSEWPEAGGDDRAGGPPEWVASHATGSREPAEDFADTVAQYHADRADFRTRFSHPHEGLKQDMGP